MSDQTAKPVTSGTPVPHDELDAEEDIDEYDDLGMEIKVEPDELTAEENTKSVSGQPTNVEQQTPAKRPAPFNKAAPFCKRKRYEADTDREVEKFYENILSDSREITNDECCTSVFITNFPRWRAKMTRQFIMKNCMTNPKLTVPRIGTLKVKYMYDYDDNFINAILVTVDCAQNQHHPNPCPKQNAALCQLICKRLNNTKLEGRTLFVYPDYGGHLNRIFITNNQLHTFKIQSIKGRSADDQPQSNKTYKQISYANAQSAPATIDNISVWQMPLTTEQDQQELYGLNRSFLHKLNISVPINDKVLVTFTSKLSLEVLRQAFDLAGRVIYAYFINPEAAVVCYSHPLEAVQAITMFDGALLYKQPISVKMDHLLKPGPFPVGFTKLGKGLGPAGRPLKNVVSSYEMMMIRAKQSTIESVAPTNSEITESTESRINIWSADDEADDMQQITKTIQKFKERGVNFDKVLSITNNVFGQSKKNDESKPTANQRIAEQANNMSSANMNRAVQTYGSTTSSPTMQNDSTNINYQGPNFNPGQNQYPTNLYMASQTPNLNPGVGVQGINLNNNMGMPGVNYNANMNTQSSNFNPVSNYNPNLGMQGSNFNPNAGNFSVNPTHNFGNQAPNFSPNVINQSSNFNPIMGTVPSNVNPITINPSPNVMEGPRIISNVEQPTQTNISNMPLQNPSAVNVDRGTVGYNPKAVGSTSTNVGSTSGSKRNDPRLLKELPVNDKKVTSKSKLVVLDSLPASVTQALLYAKMQECGEVRFVEITSPGHAFVRFENYEAAERCLLLFNKSRVDGQTIHVKYF